MERKPILIIGAGGHAKVLIDALLQQNADILGIVDRNIQNVGEKVLGIKVLGDDTYVLKYSPQEIYLVNGIGSIGPMQARKHVYDLFHQKGYSFMTVIHPSAIIGREVKLAEGVQVMAGAVIQTGCVIGINTIVNTRAVVDHECVLGNHSHIAPGAVLSGSIKIGDCTHIGTGAVIIQGKSVGGNTLVGAGAVVVNNIGSDLVACGVPAKKVT